MDIKVKSVESVESKSKQEIEKELLEEHEDTTQSTVEETVVDNTDTDESSNVPDNVQEQIEVNDELVKDYFKNKYGKEIDSIDSLFVDEASSSTDVPEDVAKFIEYRNQTGRGMQDFLKLNEDLDSLSEDALLSRFYSETETGWDREDISDHISDNFSYDEDLDDESDIRKKKRNKKKEIAKAKEYFEKQKEKYSVPLESSAASLQNNEEYLAYKQQIENSKSEREQAAKKAEYFVNKTDELFGEGFKGFEFNIDDKKFTYPVQDVEKVKETQKDISNFIKQFLNDDGLIKDAAGYHRALSIAMNPEAYAKFFYEQGVSSTIKESAKDERNITIGKRRPESQVVGKTTIKSVGNDSGNGLKFKSRK